MSSWTEAFDERAASLTRTIVDSAPEERTQPWQDLLRELGPHLEAWIGSNFALQRYGLNRPDDHRAVLVLLIGRLHANEFKALAAFLESRPLPPATLASLEKLERGARVVALATDGEQATHAEQAPVSGATPFRAWMLAMIRFCVADHIRHKLGRGQSAGAKRRANTEADPLPQDGDGAVRPPFTDWVALRTFMEEVERYLDDLPEFERAAIRGWLEGESFADLGSQLGADPRETRAAVRAVAARLRYRFSKRMGDFAPPR